MLRDLANARRTRPDAPRGPVVAWLWYRGTAFAGYQRQPGRRTVQQTFEEALARIGFPVATVAASRTDRGVHARMQICAFRAPLELDVAALAADLRRALPEDLGLCALERPPRRFHPQFQATGKEYRYRLWLSAEPVPEAWQGFAWSTRQEPRLEGRAVDPDVLARVLRSYEGEHDFGAFHESSSKRGARRIEAARLVSLEGGLYEARLVGNRFARYQVRYLVGSAVAAAAGILSEQAVDAALVHQVAMRGLKAPAHGLVLWQVRYDPKVDPFDEQERAACVGVPSAPPFSSG